MDFLVSAAALHRDADALGQRIEKWTNNNLVFCTRLGGPLDAGNVRRSLRLALTAAKLPAIWTPRELRHSFVSIMSANGAPVELIAKLVGHATTSTTKRVYRKELRPVITGGAEIIGSVFAARVD